MKKAIVISCTAASLLIILSTAGTSHALFLFITVGVIPGTNISLSANIMLGLVVVTGLLLALRLALRSAALKQIATGRLAQKTRLPRRRFSQL